MVLSCKTITNKTGLKPMARPVSDKPNKDKSITIRFDSEQLKAIDAARGKVKQSTYIRDAVLAQAISQLEQSHIKQ